MERLLLFIERKIYYRISKRINWMLDRVSASHFEIVHPDNTDVDQDGNFRFVIDSSGNLLSKFKVSGTWTTVDTIEGS